MQLIEQITNDRFEPSQYEDSVRAQTRELIEKKVGGQEITAPVAEAPKAQIIDLMAALKASLSAQPDTSAGKESAAVPIGRKPPKAAPRTAARDEAKAEEAKPKRARK